MKQTQSLWVQPRLNIKNTETDAPLSSITPQEEQQLEKTFGGYTVKQRLREEVESPFRKVRFIFFLSSMGSALTALYFSSLNMLKASGAVGTFTDTMPLNEALTNSAINLGGAVVCGGLAYRDYKAGQANLERIARGGKLAKLGVVDGLSARKLTLVDYRRYSRVLLCVGGKDYIENLNRSLNADHLSDSNVIPEKLEEVDVKVVPVLLTSDSAVGDTETCWRSTEARDDVQDKNFNVNRADKALAFPKNNAAWSDYLKSEIETANKQGYNVMEKGFTITVKKNGRILRRATGMPQWGDLIGTMEVMDGSKFGMPGDSEKYDGN